MSEPEPEGVTIWTIYDHPADYPDHFVARKTISNASGVHPCCVLIISTEVADLRAEMAVLGLSKLDRHPDDDPKIMETWL